MTKEIEKYLLKVKDSKFAVYKKKLYKIIFSDDLSEIDNINLIDIFNNELSYSIKFTKKYIDKIIFIQNENVILYDRYYTFKNGLILDFSDKEEQVINSLLSIINLTDEILNTIHRNPEIRNKYTTRNIRNIVDNIFEVLQILPFISIFNYDNDISIITKDNTVYNFSYNKFMIASNKMIKKYIKVNRKDSEL